MTAAESCVSERLVASGDQWEMRLGDCLEGMRGLANKSVDVVITDLAAGTAAEHLVCADLLLQGHHAFIAGQNCSYDVAVDVAGRLIRIQVKSTRAPRRLSHQKHDAYMWFVRRAGKGSKRTYTRDDFDMLALVALDVRRIAYLPPSAQRQTIHIRSHDNAGPTGPHSKSGRTFGQYPFASALKEVSK